MDQEKKVVSLVDRVLGVMDKELGLLLVGGGIRGEGDPEEDVVDWWRRRDLVDGTSGLDFRVRLD